MELPLTQARFATFALAIPLYRVFDYAIDEQSTPEIGTRYRLPFANGVKTGILLSVQNDSSLDPSRIKAAQEVIDTRPVIDEHMLALAGWISEYYHQPLGEVVFQCLPAYLRGSRPHVPARVKCWHLSLDKAQDLEPLQQRSPRQFEMCQALQQSSGMTAIQLKALNTNWHGIIKALQAKQLVHWEWLSTTSIIDPHPDSSKPRPSDEQQTILSLIETRQQQFGVHLLDGITGSGKTEIYLRLIESRLEAAQQVVYLVPEIGLTNQLIERVRERFGDCFAISHSGLSEMQRYRAWDRFARGEASIMLGTRSSLFSQSESLGLIIIDEEHDLSYRQEDGIRYHARDVAIKRAQMLDIPIVLGSATPALETISNCERDTWFRYQMNQRPTRFTAPTIRLIDVSNSHFESGCSAQTFKRIEHHLAQSGQVLIYLNRRGFAPIVMCHECGWQALCQNCDSRLTLHHSVRTLLCHHCGFTQSIPETCPDCDNSEIKHYGIGTEQLEQGLAQRYPETPIVRIDRDSISSREALKTRLQQLQSGEPCILIGTQMIAKGHDYPAITLSVVIDADQALFSASYRASERLAQTLYQVSGRAGRGDREGEACVQTRFPEHPMMQALANGSYRSIAATLLQERQSLGFPPYARVVMFRADGVELKAAMQHLESIKTCLEATTRIKSILCIGPIPALMTRRIGRYRAQLCLLSSDYQSLRSVLHQAMPDIQSLTVKSTVSWNIDVDAYDI
jgi:primosomal protein N' (replication factor Y)